MGVDLSWLTHKGEYIRGPILDRVGKLVVVQPDMS